jgi:sucrose-6-phosphate hydrolase SacC (GH32 family)
MSDRTADRVAYWPFDDGGGRTAQERVSGADCPIDYVFVDTTDRRERDPQWRDAVAETGLLFDGYSTSVAAPDLLSTSREALTVETWIAPRTFGSRSTFDPDVDDRLSPIVSQYDPDDDRGFVFGVFRHGTVGFKAGLGDETVNVWAEHALDTYEWAHIAATFDGIEGTLTLYVDGMEVESASFEPDRSIEVTDVDCQLGKHPVRADPTGPFDPDMVDGVLDEVSVYATAHTAAEIREAHQSGLDANGGSLPEVTEAEIGLDPDVYEGDRYRPAYHARPPGHWMNEPHAPIYYDGQYHLFYQANPRGPYWGHIHWGHWVSDDMVHWRHLPVALAPEADAVDPDGCWTGGATYDENGVPTLFYTAGNTSKTPDQAVGTASPADPDDPDLVEWEKANELAIEQPQGIGLRENDFRDPFVWKDGDTWYCLVGSGVEGEGGTALVYSSRTFEEWQFRGHLYRSDHDVYPELGPVWELPVLLPVGEDETGTQKHVFLISPVGPGADVEVYYWIGEWDPTTCSFTPDTEEPQLIDYGDFHFTGPSGFVDPQTDRSILFTIAQDNRSQQDHYESGWAHNAGLPLHLFLRDDGELGIEPIEELRSLRQERAIDLEDRDRGSCNTALEEFRSDTFEVSLEIASDGAERYGLVCKRHPDEDERTVCYYDSTRETLTVHREHSTRDIETRRTVSERSSLIHSGDLSLEDEPLRLRLFVDRSMLECYANNRRAITTRAYTDSADSTGLQVWADGDITVNSLSVWELESI